MNFNAYILCILIYKGMDLCKYYHNQNTTVASPENSHLSFYCSLTLNFPVTTILFLITIVLSLQEYHLK